MKSKDTKGVKLIRRPNHETPDWATACAQNGSEYANVHFMQEVYAHTDVPRSGPTVHSITTYPKRHFSDFRAIASATECLNLYRQKAFREEEGTSTESVHKHEDVIFSF